jgi:hypothetical protein
VTRVLCWVFSFLRHDSLSFNSIHAKFFGIAYTAQQVWTEATTCLYSLTRRTQLSSRDAIWWIYTIRIWALQRLQWNKYECVISVFFITPEEIFYFAGSHSSYSTTRSWSVLWHRIVLYVLCSYSQRKATFQYGGVKFYETLIPHYNVIQKNLCINLATHRVHRML